MGNIPENSTDEVKRKQQQYQRSHSEENEGWWRDFSACNLWTSAFFMPLTDQSLQLLPTSKALQRLLSGVENTETGVSLFESQGGFLGYWGHFIENRASYLIYIVLSYSVEYFEILNANLF